MVHVYCSECKVNVAEVNLHDGRCPKCGKLIGIPDVLNYGTKEYDVEITFIDRNTKQERTMIQHNVTEAWYNKIKYLATNVKNVVIIEEREVLQ